MEPAMPSTTEASRTSAAADPAALPHGVALRGLVAHVDGRGRVGEIFRAEWPTGVAPVQWVMSISEAGVMRGVHAHIRHDDYFVLLDGRLVLGLRDLRAGSPTGERSALLELRGDMPVAVSIPHGVAHGFLFLARSTYVLGSTHYYDAGDELGCHWQDPGLGFNWPLSNALLSPRDAALPPLRELAARMPPWRAA
jgi:dTDP-4-dehydrorhamnose 3,5-epimerase